MSRTRTLAGLTAVLLASACTVSRSGVLRAVPDGPVIPVSVTIEEDVVTVTGTDPVSGERFGGRLLADPAATRRALPLPAGGLGPGPSGSAPAPVLSGPAAVFNVSGILTGDRGTVLACDAQVERRVRLQGVGMCRPGREGEDTPVYRLSF